jgi:hypothetical protein
MIQVKPPIALTTSATDLFLGLNCVFIRIVLWRGILFFSKPEAFGSEGPT